MEAKKIPAITELVDSFIIKIRCVIVSVWFIQQKGVDQSDRRKGATGRGNVGGAQLRFDSLREENESQVKYRHTEEMHSYICVLNVCLR